MDSSYIPKSKIGDPQNLNLWLKVRHAAVDVVSQFSLGAETDQWSNQTKWQYIRHDFPHPSAHPAHLINHDAREG